MGRPPPLFRFSHVPGVPPSLTPLRPAMGASLQLLAKTGKTPGMGERGSAPPWRGVRASEELPHPPPFQALSLWRTFHLPPHMGFTARQAEHRPPLWWRGPFGARRRGPPPGRWPPASCCWWLPPACPPRAPTGPSCSRMMTRATASTSCAPTGEWRHPRTDASDLPAPGRSPAPGLPPGRRSQPGPRPPRDLKPPPGGRGPAPSRLVTSLGGQSRGGCPRAAGLRH